MRDLMDRGPRAVPLRDGFGTVIAFVPDHGDQLVGPRGPAEPELPPGGLDHVLRQVARAMGDGQ